MPEFRGSDSSLASSSVPCFSPVLPPYRSILPTCWTSLFGNDSEALATIQPLSGGVVAIALLQICVRILGAALRRRLGVVSGWRGMHCLHAEPQSNHLDDCHSFLKDNKSAPVAYAYAVVW